MGKAAQTAVASFETWKGAKLIPVEKLVIPEWNVNEMEDDEFAALLEEVKEGGFDEPCQIVPIAKGPDTGKFLVLGGAHRVKALIALNEPMAPCVLKVHLTDADELTLQEWSVRRNHIRGRVNAQKYAELEKRITGKWQISAEAARRRMLMRQEIASSRRKREATEDLDDDVETTVLSGGLDDGREDEGGSRGERGERPETDGAASRKQKFAERRALLANLKQFAQEVLAESEDTVEHGYLYFGQGGQTHLVVNESSKLYGLISAMVDACKSNSDKVDDFLISAITKELPQWQ